MPFYGNKPNSSAPPENDHKTLPTTCKTQTAPLSQLLYKTK